MESDATPAMMDSSTDATIASLAPRWLALVDEQAEKLKAEGTEIDDFQRRLLFATTVPGLAGDHEAELTDDELDLLLSEDSECDFIFESQLHYRMMEPIVIGLPLMATVWAGDERGPYMHNYVQLVKVHLPATKSTEPSSPHPMCHIKFESQIRWKIIRVLEIMYQSRGRDYSHLTDQHYNTLAHLYKKEGEGNPYLFEQARKQALFFVRLKPNPPFLRAMIDDFTRIFPQMESTSGCLVNRNKGPQFDLEQIEDSKARCHGNCVGSCHGTGNCNNRCAEIVEEDVRSVGQSSMVESNDEILSAESNDEILSEGVAEKDLVQGKPLKKWKRILQKCIQGLQRTFKPPK